MRYEGKLYRPPSEADAFIVQATIGCSHNLCTYCDMYRDKRFRIRALSEVLEDIDPIVDEVGDGQPTAHLGLVGSAADEVEVAGADAGDQKRIVTPRDAISAGASHLVVGRPVVAAVDRKAAAEAILSEMAGA